jgi:two-component system chemotaxis sensor kinase CheA
LPIDDGQGLGGLLLVIDDITEQLARTQKDAEQRELLAAFTALMQDRSGFLTFCDECERTLGALSRDGALDPSQKLSLHTLKGNSATLGLSVMAELCHRAESELARQGALLPSTRSLLNGRWQAIIGTVRAVLPAELGRTIQVSDRDLAKLTELAAAGATASRIVSEVQRLGWEPVERSLGRLAHEAQRWASRRGLTLQVSVEADELLLDPMRWSPLWSALVHLTRNAVDHGIELASERRQLGKPAQGCLQFSARRRESGFVVEVGDDGRGIDWEAGRSRCLEQGRPAQSRSELVEALLSPGFTTSQVVTESSGRGVGLAAVASVTRALSGVLSLESSAGAGTRFSLVFPAE